MLQIMRLHFFLQSLISIYYYMISIASLSSNPAIYHNDQPLSDQISPNQSEIDITPQIQQIPKKKLNAFIFLLNILWMLSTCCTIVYSIFTPPEKNEDKGKIAGVTLGLTILISFPTFFYLTTWRKLLRLAFLIDTIMVVTISTSIAFVNIILIFDHVGKWYFDLIKIGFTVEIFCYSTMVRVMLATLNWEKWQIIVFKLHLIINCLVFLLCGVTFIWVDFTYTYHMLPAYDNKVHEFMVLFIFTSFGCLYEFYNKTTDLDHTADFKYIYMIKNVDHTRCEKKKIIIKHKKDSIHSIKLLRDHQKKKINPKSCQSPRFCQIQPVLYN